MSKTISRIEIRRKEDGYKTVITEYRVKGSLGIAAGMMCHLIGFVSINLGASKPVGWGISFLATALLTYGSVNYVRAKGYSPLLGLPAIIPPGFIGLVIACLLPDRIRDAAPTEAQSQAHQAILEKARRENPKVKTHP